MNFNDAKVGDFLKSLALFIGGLAELGALVLAITSANSVSYYFEWSIFFIIFITMTICVVLSTALLYAAGVVVDNIVMIRKAVVGTNAELNRNSTPTKTGYTNTNNSLYGNKVVDKKTATNPQNEKSQAEKTMDILNSLK